jgi:hypothetical protein
VLTETELMAIHIQALFTQEALSRLLTVNEPGGGAPAPRMFLGRTLSGNLWRFRADLPENLVRKLEALCSEEASGVEPKTPRHLDEYVRLLETHAPVRKRWMGPAYHFTEYLEPSRPLIAITEANVDSLQVGFEGLIPELPDFQPFIALVVDHRPVSVCRSVRISPAAYEAGVETLPDLSWKGVRERCRSRVGSFDAGHGRHAVVQYILG